MHFNVPVEIVCIFGAAFLAVLGWIGKSIASAAAELKLLSLIIRTCPGCKTTVQSFDNAQDHSAI